MFLKSSQKYLILLLTMSLTIAACSDPDTSPNSNHFNNSNNANNTHDTSPQDTSDTSENDTSQDTNTEDTSQDTDTEDTSQDTDTDLSEPTILAGILDETFALDANTPGIFTGPAHLRSDGSGLAITSDGNILVAGRGRLTPETTSENQPADYPKMFTLQLNPDGQLTPEFGQNGLTTLAYGPQENEIVVLQTRLQPDNKTVTCGNIRSANPLDARSQLVVTRLNPDGTPDTTFGNSPEPPGIAYFDIPTDKPNSLCWALHILPTGKILVAGQVGANSTLTPLLMRLNPDGSLDETFGNNPANPNHTPGIILHDITPDDTWLYAKIREITVLPNHQILALVDALNLRTGHQNGHLLRFDADGKLDETFGKDPENPGLITLNLPNGASHEVFDFTTDPATGRIFVTGKVQHIAGVQLYRAFVHALTADGQADPTFPTFILPDVNAAARAILLQSDGKIIATGSAITHPKTEFEAGHLLAVRLLPDGQLDPTFATHGIFSHEDPELYFYTARAQLDAQNRLVITGSTPIDNLQSPRGHTFITRLR